jgi:hypothetical protein
MINILSLIPTWVFGVLALLLALGLMQTRARQVKPGVIAGVAIGMAAWSAWGVLSGLGGQLGPVAAWLAAMATALHVGPRLLSPRGLRLDAASGKVHVPGSWLPLAAMMGIFSVKFGLGMAAGMGAPVVAGSLTATACAGLLGLMSGVFAARARLVVSVADGSSTRHRAAGTAAHA